MSAADDFDPANPDDFALMCALIDEYRVALVRLRDTVLELRQARHPSAYPQRPATTARRGTVVSIRGDL